MDLHPLTLYSESPEHGIHYRFSVLLQRLTGASCYVHSRKEVFKPEQRIFGRRRLAFKDVETRCKKFF